MSKNIKIFIYIIISLSALIFLLISFVSIKASFGGLNLNIFGERISDELKLNYSFDTDVENIVLKRSSEKGFYLEIEKIQISDANGLALETSLISWDFNLFNLITFSIDEKNKISSEKINISSNDFQIFINNFNMEYDELDRVVVSLKKIDFKSSFCTSSRSLHTNPFGFLSFLFFFLVIFLKPLGRSFLLSHDSPRSALFISSSCL